MIGIEREFQYGIQIGLNKGYVIVPASIDRQDYIDTCLRNKRVSIFVESGGGVIHDVILSHHILYDILFPKDNFDLEGDEVDRFGSGVVFFQEPYSGVSVIVGVVSKVNDLNSGLYENITKFSRYDKDKFASIIIDGSGGIVLNTNDDIKLLVKGRDSKLDIVSEGSVAINSSKDVTILSSKEVVIESSKTTRIKPDKLIIGDEDKSQPIPLGDELKSQLETLSNRVDNIVSVLKTTITSSTTSPNLTWFEIIDPIVESWKKESFNNIRSDKSFTE